MIIDNVGFFLAFTEEKVKRLLLLLLSVNFRHFCGYLEIKEEGCFYVLLENICYKRPPGETDFKYVHLFRQSSPLGILWSRNSSVFDRKSSLHMKAPKCIKIF